MIVAGEVYVEGPGLIKRLKDGEKICIEKNGMEFILKVSNSPKEKIEISPWIQLDDDDILIQSQLNNMDTLYAGEFSLCIKDSKDQDIELNFSIDQIRVMKELFDNYLTAFEAHRRLEKEYSVKARKKSV